MARLTDGELQAEYSRAAAVVGIHGPHSLAKHVIITHRFLTTPHYDEKEPVMTKIPAEAPAGTVLAYAKDIDTIPPVRISFRLDGFQAGWAAYAAGGKKFEAAAEDYDRASRVDGIPVARRRTAYNGFKDGWNAAKEAKK